MTKHEFHNTLRKLFNIEWSQLSFLTESQKDNFFENPPRFFIAADDETADQIWALLFPKPPVAGGQVVRFPGGQPYETRDVEEGTETPNDARRRVGLKPLSPLDFERDRDWVTEPWGARAVPHPAGGPLRPVLWRHAAA